MDAYEHFSAGEKALSRLGNDGQSILAGIALASAHFQAASAHAAIVAMELAAHPLISPDDEDFPIRLNGETFPSYEQRLNEWCRRVARDRG